MAALTYENPPAPDLPAALRNRCEAVIEAELDRLARRTALGGADLEIVAGALRGLVQRLILDRASIDTDGSGGFQVAALFNLETTC